MAENRVPMSVMVDPATRERLRDAAYSSLGETISSIVEKGSLAYVERLEAGRGAPFPPRSGEVRRHRPKKPSS